MADQGYVVVASDITGSLGYGAEFVNAIRNEYGGLPFDDLVLCWKAVDKELLYADVEHGVAMGGSYGG